MLKSKNTNLIKIKEL